MSRPAKLPFSARRITKALTALDPSEKFVWLEDHEMDQDGDDGCFMSNESMGKRLGLKPRTVEQARNHLKRLGLHEPIVRKEGRNLGWVATLPSGFSRPGPKLGNDEVESLAQAIDRHIKRTDGCKPNAPAGADGLHQLVQAGAAALEGGQGGGSLQSQARQLSETQLPSAVRKKGVFAMQTGKTGVGEPLPLAEPILPLMTVQEGGKSREEKIAEWRAAAAEERARKAQG